MSKEPYPSAPFILAVSVAALLAVWAPSVAAKQGSGMTQVDRADARRADAHATYDGDLADTFSNSDRSQAVTSPRVVLFEPNGGEVFRAGSRDTVRWSIADSIDIDSVNIYYSVDGGSTFPFKIASLGPTDSTYVWVIPNTPSRICKVKIVAFDSAGNQVSGTSDGTFAIAPRMKRRVPPSSYFNMGH